MKTIRASSASVLVGLVAAAALAVLLAACSPQAGAPPVLPQDYGPIAAFPLRVAEDNRHLVDATGRPFVLRGRAAWSVLTQPVASYRAFLDDTKAKGFNAVEVLGIVADPGSKDVPFAGDKTLPFGRQLGGGPWQGAMDHKAIEREAPDLTTPNEAYWAFVEAFVDACRERGIVVLFFPAYVGYKGGDKGWMREMVANGPTRVEAYGEWIARRFQGKSNLVWMLGGDYGRFRPAETEVERALIRGLKRVAPQASTLYSALWDTNTIGTDQPDFGGELNLNGVYSWSGETASLARRAYRHVPVMPAYLVEEPYDEEGPDGNAYNPHATQPVRRFVYWAWLESLAGYVVGNGYVWTFNAGWERHLDSPGTRDMQLLNGFVASIPWWRLVPDGQGSHRPLVTAGGGTIDTDSHVAAAATRDGDLAVVYLGPCHGGAISIDMSRLSGTVTARWFDPSNGNYLPAGTHANAGVRSFKPPGRNRSGARDWVLRLDASPSGAGSGVQAEKPVGGA